MTPLEQDRFEAELSRDGFSDIGIKELKERPVNEPHSHSFDARALILGGAFTLTIDGKATTYFPGDSYFVPAGCVHQETIPAGGVRYVYGLRQVEA